MNNQAKEFLQLIQCFTKEELHGSKEEFNDELTAISAKIDNIINPNDKEQFRLKTDNICPIVCATQTVKYAILGLNPHDDEVDFSIYDTWEKWANYHTQLGLENENSFKRVTEKIGKYYQVIGILIASLENKKLIKWDEFRGSLSNKELQKKYLDMLESCPIAVGELIPFSSKKISTFTDKKIDRLFTDIPQMRQYLVKLISIVKEKVSKDGMIICNGRGISEAFLVICKYLGKEYKLDLEIDKRAEGYAVYKLENIKVLMLFNSVRNRGKLNSYNQIERMINVVCNI